jgi:membrane dipeptidase
MFAGKVGWPEPSMFGDYFSRARNTGINAVGLSISNHFQDFEHAHGLLQNFLVHITQRSQPYLVIRNSCELDRVAATRNLGFYFCAQGSSILNDEPEHYLPLLKSMGLGVLSLVYNGRFPAGDGCMVESPGPITEYGTRVIDQLHLNRVILDLSHASEETALSAIEYSCSQHPGMPIIYSHSAPASVCSAYRNISDAEIIACAGTGGVIGLNMCPWFIVDELAVETTAGNVVDAIQYVDELVGIRHVSLASDDVFSWEAVWRYAETSASALHEEDLGPKALKQRNLTLLAAKNKPYKSAEPARIYPAVADEMWSRGYSDTDIANVLGGNFLRVARAVWGSGGE